MFRGFLPTCFLPDIFSSPALSSLWGHIFKRCAPRTTGETSKPFIWVVGVNAVILIIQVVPSGWLNFPPANKETNNAEIERGLPASQPQVGSSLTGSNKMHDASQWSSSLNFAFGRGSISCTPCIWLFYSNQIGLVRVRSFFQIWASVLNLLLFLGSESLMSGFSPSWDVALITCYENRSLFAAPHERAGGREMPSHVVMFACWDGDVEKVFMAKLTFISLSTVFFWVAGKWQLWLWGGCR